MGARWNLCIVFTRNGTLFKDYLLNSQILQGKLYTSISLSLLFSVTLHPLPFRENFKFLYFVVLTFIQTVDILNSKLHVIINDFKWKTEIAADLAYIGWVLLWKKYKTFFQILVLAIWHQTTEAVRFWFLYFLSNRILH